VTIPASVTNIGNFAFDGCTGLISVTFQRTMASNSFGIYPSFPGDLQDRYLAANGGAGTYTRPDGLSTWTKQP